MLFLSDTGDPLANEISARSVCFAGITQNVGVLVKGTAIVAD